MQIFYRMDAEEEQINIDFKKFKGHHRKFPWALIIRIIVATVSIGIIFVLVEYLNEAQKNRVEDDSKIEIEFEP